MYIFCNYHSLISIDQLMMKFKENVEINIRTFFDFFINITNKQGQKQNKRYRHLCVSPEYLLSHQTCYFFFFKNAETFPGKKVEDTPTVFDHLTVKVEKQKREPHSDCFDHSMCIRNWPDVTVSHRRNFPIKLRLRYF